MFGRKKQRSIPLLNPNYYVELRDTIAANGGSGALNEVAAGVATAIFNVGMTYFGRLGDQYTGKNFDGRFGNRRPEDMDVADAMIDFLVAHDAGTEQFITTLLIRLKDVQTKSGSSGG